MSRQRAVSRTQRPQRRRRPLRSFLTAARWHRRLLASFLAAAAVAAALAATSPPSVPTVPVVVTAHDLAGGELLEASDVEVVQVPAGSVPAHTFTSVADVPRRPLVGPKRAGIVVTDLDVIAPGLLARYGAGMVAVPVRIADAGSLAYVRVGDRIDLIAAGTVPITGAGGVAGATSIVASSVPVLAVAPNDATETGEGGLLVVVTTSVTARAIAAAAITSRVSVALRSSS